MGIELFERAVRGGGQLLAVGVRLLDGSSDRVGSLMLTFDLGRITVSVEPVHRSLLVEFIDSTDAAPPGLEDASEKEPWWRLLGNPVARVWEAGSGPEGTLCLQFRADDQSPRIVTLEPQAGSVSICLENPPD